MKQEFTLCSESLPQKSMRVLAKCGNTLGMFECNFNVETGKFTLYGDVLWFGPEYIAENDLKIISREEAIAKIESVEGDWVDF